MSWQEALNKLATVAPKLAFKDGLVSALKAHAALKDPPTILLAQLEVVASVAEQNIRVSQLHGYPGLELHAKAVKVAVQEVVSALKNVGVTPQKTQQAQQI